MREAFGLLLMIGGSAALVLAGAVVVCAALGMRWCRPGGRKP